MNEDDEAERPPRYYYRNVAVQIGPSRWSLDGWQLEREYCRLGYRSEKRGAGPKPKSPRTAADNDNDESDSRPAKERQVVKARDGTDVASRCQYRIDEMPDMHGDYSRVAIQVIGNAGRFVVIARCLGGFCDGKKLVKMSPGKWVDRRIQLRCQRCNRTLLAKFSRMEPKGAA